MARRLSGEVGGKFAGHGGALLSTSDCFAAAELCGAGARDAAGGFASRIAAYGCGVSGAVAGAVSAAQSWRFAMRCRSTGGKAPLTSLRGAVLRGLAPDGGLYMPAELARRSPEELEEFRALPFTEVCFRVVKPFASPAVPQDGLWQIVSEAVNFPVKM